MADEPVDDLDDLYGPSSPKLRVEETSHYTGRGGLDTSELTAQHGAALSSIPGLGLPASIPARQPQQGFEMEDKPVRTGEESSVINDARAASVHGPSTPNEQALPESSNVLNKDLGQDDTKPDTIENFRILPSSSHGVHATTVKTEQNTQIKSEEDTEITATGSEGLAQPSREPDNPAVEILSNLNQGPIGADTITKVDPDFLQAAEVQKGDTTAEWQYDSSDMESSSDSSTDSSSDDDSDDDEDYEMLDPATAAKMLMAEEGGDDDDGQPSKGAANAQLRTKNEKPPEIVPKPDVTVTPEMQITFLGSIENVVDNYVLVKANVSGEYQVLEQGSVLCMEDRTVIGAVAETFGRVQEPLYSILFTSKQDIEDAGLTAGVGIHYVNQHSTFVFTQPLRNIKGTDASNLHDEEIGDEEMEFSDDEAEAAYKRAKKQAKRGGKAGAGGQLRNDHSTHASAPSNQPINYDDDNGDEGYTPLSRPTDFQELASGRQEPSRAPPAFDRGRGRGGRGRSDRGRGDRGRNDRGRGGRGGRGGVDDNRQRRAAANSYPDQHNTDNRVPQESSYPAQARQTNQSSGSPTNWPPPPPIPPQWFGQQYQNAHTSQQQAYNFAAMFQQQQQQQGQQAYAWPQYSQAQQTQPQPNQHMPFPFLHGQQAQGSNPAAAATNPAYLYNQQQQQTPQQSYPAVNQYQNTGQGSNSADQATLQQQLEYLRRLGGGQ